MTVRKRKESEKMNPLVSAVLECARVRVLGALVPTEALATTIYRVSQAHKKHCTKYGGKALSVPKFAMAILPRLAKELKKRNPSVVELGAIFTTMTALALMQGPGYYASVWEKPKRKKGAKK